MSKQKHRYRGEHGNRTRKRRGPGRIRQAAAGRTEAQAAIAQRFAWLRQGVARGGRCEYCGKAVTLDGPNQATIDHILPLSRGGSDEPENWAVSCVGCNHTKNNRTPEEAGMIRRPR